MTHADVDSRIAVILLNCLPSVQDKIDREIRVLLLEGAVGFAQAELNQAAADLELEATRSDRHSPTIRATFKLAARMVRERVR